MNRQTSIIIALVSGGITTIAVLEVSKIADTYQNFFWLYIIGILVSSIYPLAIVWREYKIFNSIYLAMGIAALPTQSPYKILYKEKQHREHIPIFYLVQEFGKDSRQRYSFTHTGNLPKIFKLVERFSGPKPIVYLEVIRSKPKKAAV